MTKLHPSLLVKLTLLAGTAAVSTVFILFAAGNIFFEDLRDHNAHRIGSITQLAVRAILHKPTPAKLTAVSRELHINIRYRDNTINFTTDEAMPTFSEVKKVRRHRYRRWNLPPEFAVTRVRDEHYLFYRSGSQRALIALEDDHTWGLIPVLIIGAVSTLLLVWGGVYYLIRRQLAPLSALRRDMQAVGSGEWRQCKTSRRDEVGMLALGFNDMQERLKNMIAARERFLIAASHELRSPIARLKLAAEMISDDETKTAVNKDLSELQHLTSDILQNARLQSEHSGLVRQAVAVEEFIQTIISGRTRAEQERCTADCTAAAGLSVSIDTTLMTRAINNLLDNAFKYADNADITVRAEEGKHTVAIAIGDNGSGVADKDLPHLFEPFFRADESRTRATGGFGLGLALVAAAVHAHNGSISAANRQPHGLVITIKI